MWNQYLDPIIQQGLQWLVQVIVLAILFVAFMLRKVVVRFLQAHLSKSQMDTLHALGEEAYNYAEAQFKNAGGSEKMKQALAYFTQKAQKRGLPIDQQEATASIQKAWATFEGIHKMKTDLNPKELAQELGKTVVQQLLPSSAHQTGHAPPAENTTVQPQG